MKMPNGDRRLFRGSLGRILVLLYHGDRTVSELSEHLKLTDNTVRTHLATLERDGFVEQRGLRPGFRKPHNAYHLTTAAEQLFLKACDPLLDNVLSVLAARETAEAFEAVLRDAGHRMAARVVRELEGAERARRIDRAMDVLRDLGGVVEASEEAGTVFLRGSRCPLSVVVAEHPQVCMFAETVLSDIVDVPVQEHCEKGGTPRCRFEFAMDIESRLLT
jgi:predicted ArsR family transcriptional regulator